MSDPTPANAALVVLAAGLGERFGGLKQLAPVGPGGETLMDYSIRGAVEAGCRHVVIVVRSEIEGAIRDHLEEIWGSRLNLESVEQPVGEEGKPEGTAMALLECRGALGDDPFVVINSDDLYLPPVIAVLHRWLSGSGSSHALVGFPLGLTVLPDSGPVTRAVCSRRPDGELDELIESKIERRGKGFVARPIDGRAELEVGPAQLVSMNAWGFRPSLWPVFEPAVETRRAGQAPGSEVFLPVVVTGLLGEGENVAVLPVDVPCFGVTWADDLDALRQRIQGLIDSGVYPRRL